MLMFSESCGLFAVLRTSTHSVPLFGYVAWSQFPAFDQFVPPVPVQVHTVSGGLKVIYDVGAFWFTYSAFTQFALSGFEATRISSTLPVK